MAEVRKVLAGFGWEAGARCPEIHYPKGALTLVSQAGRARASFEGKIVSESIGSSFDSYTVDLTDASVDSLFDALLPASMAA
jgi:hypothetical protein